jgi:hypothetical protein
MWFDVSCIQTTFPTSAPAVPGSAGRGVINGPSLFKSDMTLSKNIQFGERYKLQLRAESFNVFNQTNFVSPTLTANTARTTSTTTGITSGFGAITSARDPRTFQFGARFTF